MDLKKISKAGRVFRWLMQSGERIHTNRRRTATIAAGVFTLTLGYQVVFGHNGLTAYQQKRNDTKQLESQLRDLQRENERLRAHVDRLQGDPNAIEHQAREELHYTRPGEVIYTLPVTPDSTKKK